MFIILYTFSVVSRIFGSIVDTGWCCQAKAGKIKQKDATFVVILIIEIYIYIYVAA